MSGSNDDDEVGYGKPPKNTRFKPGQSGNPKGRPKGALSLSTVVARALKEKVTIVEDGRRRRVSKFEAAVKQLVNKAVKGDSRAMEQLMHAASSLDLEGRGGPMQDTDIDRAVIAGLIKRLNAEPNDGGGSPSESGSAP